MVQAGGNTRLRILRELYEETQDERFLWVDCLYKPWVCESEVMLAHLRENDLRSDLTFIDRARAVLEAKALIEAETGQDDISQRQLEKVFKAPWLQYRPWSDLQNGVRRRDAVASDTRGTRSRSGSTARRTDSSSGTGRAGHLAATRP